MKTRLMLSVAAILSAAAGAFAADVSLNASDALGTTSFNTGLHWSDGQPPGAGNNYFTAGFALRTPGSAASFTFGGDSLTINGGNMLYKGTASSTITVSNLTLDGGSINHGQGGAIVLTLMGGVNLAAGGGTFNLGENNTRQILVPDPIVGVGNLTVTSSSQNGDANTRTISLTASNTYAGTTTVNNSNTLVQIGNNTTNGTLGQGAVFVNSGRLRFRRLFEYDVPNSISGGGQVEFFNGVTRFTGDNSGFGGPILLEQNGVLVVDDSSDLGFATRLTIAADNAETARLVLSNNVSVLSGAASVFSMRSSSTDIITSHGFNTYGASIDIQTGGGQVWINSVEGELTLNGPTIQSIATSGIRGITLKGAGNGIVNSTIANGAGTSIVPVTKEGTGTWVLNGANLYTGNTTISEGTLGLGLFGSIADTPLITVSSGAVFDASGSIFGHTVAAGRTLQGSGTVKGAITVQGELRPGTSVGTLAFENALQLNGASTTFELSQFGTAGSGTNDLVTVGGDLTLTGVNNLTIISTAGAFAPSYRLFTYGGTLGGSAAANLAVANGADYRQTFTLDDTTSGQINLNVSGQSSNLVWSGSVDGLWNIRSSANWNAGSEMFYQADKVTFDDSSAGGSILLIGQLLPGSLTVDSALDYSFDGEGNIGGGTGIRKGGTGTLTVNTTNTYDGEVTVSNGILRIGHAAALGTGVGATRIAGGTLDVNGRTMQNFMEPFFLQGTGLNGTGAVINTGVNVQNGPKMVTLTGDATLNTSEGRLDIRGAGGVGYLDLAGFTLTKAGTNQSSLVDLSITNGGSLAVQEGILGITRSYVFGTGGVSAADGATLYFENNSTGLFDKVVTMTNATLRCSGSSFAVGGGIDLAGSNTVDVLGAVVFTATNALTGAGGFAKAGTGVFALAADSAYAGPTHIENGTLRIGDGGTNGTIGAGDVFNNGLLAYYRSDTVSLSSPLTGLGGIAQQGTGVLQLAAANLHSGVTRIDAGTILLVGGADRLSAASTLAFGGSGTFDMATYSPSAAGLSNTTAGADGVVTGSGTLTLTGAAIVGHTTAGNSSVDLAGIAGFVFNNTAANLEVGARYAYTGAGFMDLGTATLILPASSDIAANQVRVGTTGMSGNGLGHGDLQLGQATTMRAAALLAGATAKNDGLVRFKPGLVDPTLLLEGNAGAESRVNITLGAGGSGYQPGIGRLDLVGGIVTAYVGTATLGNSGAANKGSVGAIYLGRGLFDATTVSIGESVNSNSGPIDAVFTIAEGHLAAPTIRLAEQTSVFAAAVTGRLSLANGSIRAGSIVGGEGAAVRLFDWSGGVVRNYDESSDLNVSNLVVTLQGLADHSVDVSSGRVARVDATLLGDGNLAKDGSGTMILSGTNDYAGGTWVRAGTLLVNSAAGSGTGTGAVTVAAGATLGGTGIVGGVVTVAVDGVLSPGASPGTLTISNNLVLAGGSILPFELGTSSDKVVVTGDLAMGGRLQVTGGAGFGVGSYTLFEYAGALSGPEPVVESAPAGYNYDVDTSTPGQVKLVVSLSLNPFEQWQVLYFGSTNAPNSGPQDDADNDSNDNETEYNAGTNPTNSASAFKVLQAVRSGNDVLVTWSAAGVRTNRVQVGTNLLVPDFVDRGAPVILAAPGDAVTNLLDAGGATNAGPRFYRIRVEPPAP